MTKLLNFTEKYCYCVHWTGGGESMGFKCQGLAEPQKKLNINLNLGSLHTAEDRKNGLQKTKSKPYSILVC